MNSVPHSTKADPYAVATERQLDAKASPSPESVTGDDISVLRAIVEATASSTGEEFFQSLVRHLSQAIEARYVFVAEFADVNTRVRTLAYWFRDRLVPDVELLLHGPPSPEIVNGTRC